MRKQKTVKFEVNSAHARILYEDTDSDVYYTPNGVMTIARFLTDMCKELETISLKGDLNNE